MWEPPFLPAGPVPLVVVRRSRTPVVRRSIRYRVPALASGPVPTPVGRRIRVVFVRRGGVFEPVWAQQAATPPPPYPPVVLRPRVKQALQRRGQLAEPPWPQAVPVAAPVFVPDVRRRRLGLPWRRARAPIAFVAAQALPPATIARRRVAARTRRPAVFLVPFTVAYVASPARTRRKPALKLRPGRQFAAPWPQIAAPLPPPYPPSVMRARRPVPLLRRRVSWPMAWTVTRTPAGRPDGLSGTGRIGGITVGRLAVKGDGRISDSSSGRIGPGLQGRIDAGRTGDID